MIKLKGRHFDETEVLHAELEAVLNTLTEHDYQDAFKNGRRSGNGHTYGRGLLHGSWWLVRPKKVSDQKAARTGNFG
jgi:hypothetical protein